MLSHTICVDTSKVDRNSNKVANEMAIFISVKDNILINFRSESNTQKHKFMGKINK
ncbi:MAG: hypothetical protein WC929_05935 [Bacilli bacterium]|jgi:hypothetical protein|nr:hypothetical protein [Bacilli bacterium]MDD4056398.1 hypothetical protein [Bacilli bacterium]